MRIIAIDPGYERLGIAVIEKDPQINKGRETLLYSTCFKTPASAEFTDRLFWVGKEIERVIEEYTPSILADRKSVV